MTTTEITIASLLTEATEVIPTAMNAVWTFATSNPLVTFFMGVGILGLGFSMFRKVRRTVH